MKDTILSSIIAIGSVAAQMTVGLGLLNVAAVDVNDPGYTTCSVVADHLASCITSLGGTEALYTADPTAILGCACCTDSTAIYPYFSACSSYLSEEGGLSYSDSYSAYSELYNLCDMNGDCSGGSGTTATEETSTTESLGAEATDSSSGGLRDTSSAVGVTVGPTATETTVSSSGPTATETTVSSSGPTATETTVSSSGDNNNAAASVRVACGAILAAIAGLAIAL